MRRKIGSLLLFLGAGAIALAAFEFIYVQVSHTQEWFDAPGYLIVGSFLVGLALIIVGLSLRFPRRGGIGTPPLDREAG